MNDRKLAPARSRWIWVVFLFLLLFPVGIVVLSYVHYWTPDQIDRLFQRSLTLKSSRGEVKSLMEAQSFRWMPWKDSRDRFAGATFLDIWVDPLFLGSVNVDLEFNDRDELVRYELQTIINSP
jgi:hypothetical protein